MDTVKSEHGRIDINVDSSNPRLLPRQKDNLSDQTSLAEKIKKSPSLMALSIFLIEWSERDSSIKR